MLSGKNQVELVECPRDAMQGIHDYIPVSIKVEYLNRLLRVGFDTLDFGSFVSPKAIPQLRDTAEVLDQLDLSATKSKLLAIVANERGANDALQYEQIEYIGFPFSISETFQLRNTNSSIAESLATVARMQDLCLAKNRQLVVYISMAFGNPYGDEWQPSLALEWTSKIASLGVRTIALADTVGIASEDAVSSLFQELIPSMPEVNIGAHLHCTSTNWKGKLNAAWEAGCRRYDSAMRGFGGCPMAEDELVGNLATENLIAFLDEKNISLSLNKNSFQDAWNFSGTVFSGSSATS
jgi:hydroxymethylglutaryl-CoA lyase